MKELVRYNEACRAIARAKNVDEVKVIRKIHDAIRAAAKIAGNKKLEVDAAEIRFRAERKLGQLMEAQKSSVGLNRGAKGSGRKVRVDARPTLSEAGIGKHLADRARKLKAIPDKEFETVVDDWRVRVEREGERVTTKLLKAGEREMNNAALRGVEGAMPRGKFSVIYADPPWSFKAWSGEGKDRAAENHYPTMSQKEIEALPISKLATKNCALFLWAVWPQLPEALSVIEAWGFEYKTCGFLWVKTNKKNQRIATGMGYWTRANTEVCLIATKGSPKRIKADVHQVVMAPRLAHSAKPAEIYDRIERLVPGPYVELFARQSPRNGWRAWGNEVV